MSDDDIWPPTAFLTAPPFSFTLSIPLSMPQETPTGFPASTPPDTRTPFETNRPTFTKTGDPTGTGVLLSTFRPPSTRPHSFPLTFWSNSITIVSPPLSSPRPTSDPMATTHTSHSGLSTFTRTRHTHSFPTHSSSFRSSFTTFSSFMTSSPSLTSSHSSLMTFSSSSRTSSMPSSSSRSSSMFSRTSSRTSSTTFPPPVTQTTLPMFTSDSQVGGISSAVHDSSPDI